MHLTEIAKLRAIDDPATLLDFGLLSVATLEVAADPRLARCEKALDLPLRMRPAAPRGKGNCHHQPSVRFDGDPQGSRTGRPAKPVFEWAAEQFHPARFEVQ